MKKTTNCIFAKLSSSQIENLTNVVKETIAFETGIAAIKTFTSADLRNIQKQSRGRWQRKFF